MKSVYLAGPINGLTYEEAVAWRNVATGYLSNHGILGRSPMRSKEFLAGIGKIGIHNYSSTSELASDRGIVARDKYDVRTCDLMLVNLLNAPFVSCGTPVEYGWADILGTPIITVMTENSLYNHPFIRQLSGYIVNTLEDGLEIAVAILS